MDRRHVLGFILALAAEPALAAGPPPDKKKGGGISFVQIAPMTATVIRMDGRRGVLTVEAGLDVPNEKLRTRAESLIPRLRAAFAQVLRTYAAGMSPATAPNADLIAQALQRETDRILGQKGARLLLGAMLVS